MDLHELRVEGLVVPAHAGAGTHKPVGLGGIEVAVGSHADPRVGGGVNGAAGVVGQGEADLAAVHVVGHGGEGEVLRPEGGVRYFAEEVEVLVVVQEPDGHMGTGVFAVADAVLRLGFGGVPDVVLHAVHDGSAAGSRDGIADTGIRVRDHSKSGHEKHGKGKGQKFLHDTSLLKKMFSHRAGVYTGGRSGERSPDGTSGYILSS